MVGGRKVIESGIFEVGSIKVLVKVGFCRYEWLVEYRDFMYYDGKINIE